jgi:NAD(P)-dependent dehydrogenase (short-subunit alcohol dehydrogenase family)
MVKNQVAIVTGVSSGIGRETVLLLAERGARVFGTVRRQQKTAHGDQARAVAEAVGVAVEAKRPRQRYPVGGGRALSRLRRFIPERIFDRQFRKQFHLDEAA